MSPLFQSLSNKVQAFRLNDRRSTDVKKESLDSGSPMRRGFDWVQYGEQQQ
jgi:hypothetical protein